MPNRVFPITLISVFASLTSFAQTSKGTRILGLSAGNIRYQRDAYSHTGHFNALVQPTAGTFISDKVAVGVGLPVTYSTARFYDYGGYPAQEKVLQLAVLPWVRYYAPSTSRHRVFGEVGAGVNLSRYRYVDSQRRTYTSRYGNFIGNAGIGYSYFVTPQVGLEALLAYTFTGGSTAIYGSGSMNLNLGFRVYLPHASTITSPAD